MNARAATGAAVLQARVTDAITQAVLQEWAEKGYARISMEAVARRAGVGKSALYRRWPSKQAMALAVLDGLHGDVVTMPNTGSFERDLDAMMQKIQALLDYPGVAPIMADLVAETTRDRELGRAAETLIRMPYRALWTEVFDRAKARGELSETANCDVVVDSLISQIFWRIVVRSQPMTEDFRCAVIATLRDGYAAHP